MPDYVLRDIPDDLWRKVKAKAALEGITVKQLILHLLKKSVAAFLLLAAVGCRPDLTAPAPTPLPAIQATPASIAMTVSPATSAYQNLITLYVRDAQGLGVSGVTVTLTTTAGTLSQPTIQSGPTGQAQSLLTTRTDATVTARAGDISASVAADAYEPPKPPPAPRPPPPPPPTPPPPPPPPPPAPALSATITCTPVAHGSPTPCNVTVTYGASPVPSAMITDVDWDWGDGNTTLNQTSPVATHTYVNAGTYTVFVTVTATTADGAKTATATRAVTIP